MKETNREQEFDDLLKKKSEDFELKPSDEVWSNVESSFKRNRRRGIFWWSMAALLTAAIGTSAYFILQNENSLSKKSVVEQSAESKESKSSVNDNNSVAQQKSNDMSNKNSAENEIADDEKNSAVDKVRKEEVVSNRGVGKQNSEKKSEALVSKKDFPVTNNQIKQQDLLAIATPDAMKHLDGKNSELLSFNQLIIEKNFPPIDLAAGTGLNTRQKFTVELEGMPIGAHISTTIPEGSPSSFGNQVVVSAAQNKWMLKGFSIGSSFYYHPASIWMVGVGVNFTETYHPVNFSDTQVSAGYDTTYIFDGSIYVPQVTSYSDTSIIVSNEEFNNQWLDLSLKGGVKLFPDSKNHVQVLAGIAWTHKLATVVYTNSSSTKDQPSQFTTANNTFIPYEVAYKENLWQLMSEVSYARDLSKKFDVSAGIQFHYYPQDLFYYENYSQHMFWIGLKVGAQYSF